MVQMLILPARPGLRERLSFWLAMSVGAGLMLGFVVDATGMARWWLAVLVATPIALVIGLLVPRLVRRAYRVWSALAQGYVGAARDTLLHICFLCLFVVVGRSGSRLSLSQPGTPGTTWVPRRTLTPEGYAGQDEFEGPGTRGDGWFRSTIIWARGAGHWWMVWLVPYLAMLRYLEAELAPTRERSAPPRGIYTLY